MSRRLPVGGPGLLLPLLLLFASASCGRKDAKVAPPAQAMPVKVQTAKPEKVNDTTEYVSTLKSRDSAVIMPQVEGQITKIFVRSGDRVNAGTPLMQIDPAKQQATVKSQEDTHAAAEANLKYAEQQYARAKDLSSAGVISKQEFDQAKSAVDNAHAQVRALSAQVREQQVELHYYRVAAPSSGIVGDIPVHVGDRVTVSTILTTVDKPGTLEAYVYVPIERAPKLKMNMPVDLVDGSGNVIAKSKVSFISPQVDNTTQSVLVKAQIANQKDALRQSQFVRARVIWGSQDTPVVPVLAVSRIGGEYFAFVAEPDSKGGYVARQKVLKVGQIVGNDYVVVDGIKSGDRVIVSGTQFLIDGTGVVPQEASST
jgi:RND family efflux transporter MFP subunit